LQQELFDAEQKKFLLGASVPYNVTLQQRDLITAQSAEVTALVSYATARVALDQALGTTLETNHVSIGEARNGRVARKSELPATLPERQ
jgi:outer membrane protein TolC